MWASLISVVGNAYASYSAARTSGKVASIMNAANKGLYAAQTRLNNANYNLAVGAGKIQAAEAATQVAMRQAANATAAAQSTLAAHLKNIATRTAMRHAAERQEAEVEAGVRTLDAVQHRNFEESIRGAEEWGRAVASSASSGLAGAGMEAIASAMSLRAARMEQSARRSTAQAESDVARRVTGHLSEALLGTDATTIGYNYQVGSNFSQSYLPYKDYVKPPVTQMGANTTQALIAGLFSDTKSLSTLLGSFAKSPVTSGGVATPYTAGGGAIQGTALPSFNWNFGSGSGVSTTPYQSSNIQGSALPSISLN